MYQVARVNENMNGSKEQERVYVVTDSDAWLLLHSVYIQTHTI